MHFIRLADVRQLTPEELAAELKTKESAGPSQTIAGTDCYDISDEAARSIASMYAHRDEPGHAFLWLLSNGEPVGPEYIHDDIDHNLEAWAQSTDASEVRDDDVIRLLRLKGWLYLRAFNAPRDIEAVPEAFQLKFSSISVRELIGRYVANRNGVQFKIIDVRYNLKWGKVSFELADLDDEGQVVPDSGSGIFALEGWTVLG